MTSWSKASRVEIQLGRHGFYDVKNANRVPLGGLVRLRNASLADYAVRTGGGADQLGTAITGTPTIRAAVDYWPTTVQQRTVVKASDGNIYKDDGTGHNWVSVASGLTDGGSVPTFSIAGAEEAGQARKLFYADRISTPQVLAADGAAAAPIALPNVDWATNKPGFFTLHQGYLWAGGNTNAPHTLYRSLLANHENFQDSVEPADAAPFTIICGPEVNEEYLAGAVTYRGGLVVWKYPFGCYYIDTTTDLTSANWKSARISDAGLAGPRAFCLFEGDVLWVDPQGGWHTVSTVQAQAKASVRATDLSYRKLTTWSRQNLNLTRLSHADLLYHALRQEVMLGAANFGQTQKNRRLHLDGNMRDEVGENWLTWDRDINEALFLRKTLNNDYEPCMGDNAGQVWLLDREERSKDGAAYLFEAWTVDTDFAQSAPTWGGRKKNLRYLQVEYYPASTATLTVEIYGDNVLRQTLSVALQAAGGMTFPLTFPLTFTEAQLTTTPYYPLYGQYTRVSVRAYLTAAVDVVLTKFILGMELAQS